MLITIMLLPRTNLKQSKCTLIKEWTKVVHISKIILCSSETQFHKNNTEPKSLTHGEE